MKDNHTILFVDDEANILSSLTRLFRKEQYHILTADNARDAIAYFKDNNISLVISDQRMPQVTGVQLLERVRNISPDTIRIMLTGYADIKAAMAAINRGEVYRFIGKPWNDDDIKLVVKQALEQLDLKLENERLADLTERQNRDLISLNSSLEQKVEERTAQLEQSFYTFIRICADLIELFSPSLGGHSKRTAALAGEIAVKTGMERQEVELMETAALLHDIGLIGIPKYIISKNRGAMTEAELSLYMQHPAQGQETLARSPGLKQAGVLIRSHHESWQAAVFQMA